MSGEKYKNIAQQGNATQIDDWVPYGEHGAEKAIDGDINGVWNQNSITQTKTAGSDAWWKVTFRKWYYIDEIWLYNREDCCQERMVGATVFVGMKLLPGKGTQERVSIMKDVNLSGWMVEVRGGTAYLSLAEVDVYGIESELTFSLVDLDGMPRDNGVLVVNIDNSITQKVCFSVYIEITADFICKSLGYGTQIETTSINIDDPTKVRAYMTGLDCFLKSSLMQCNYELADECGNLGTYISCSCTEQQYWYDEFCVSCPRRSTSSKDRKTCICPPGEYFYSLVSSCRPCPAGSYNLEGSICLKCPAGFDSLPRAGKCSCAAGTYTLEDGTCKPCPGNSYSKLGSRTCLQCPGITKSNLYQSTCSCIAGLYWESGYCKVCADDTYSKYNSTECTNCPGGSGKDKGINCNCEPGYFWNNATCEACQEGYVSYSGYSFCIPCPDVYDPVFKEHCPEKLNVRKYLDISACLLVVSIPLIAASLAYWCVIRKINASTEETTQSIHIVET